MEITEKNKAEAREILAIMERVDRMDAAARNQTGTEIARFQPVILGVFNSRRSELSLDEQAEVLRLCFIIWEYFKIRKPLREVKITPSQYLRYRSNETAFINYLAKEEPVQGKRAEDLAFSAIHSRVLWTAIIRRSYQSKVLQDIIGRNPAGLYLLDLRALIKCFDEIVEVDDSRT